MILKMVMFVITRGDYFRSDSIFIKKITKSVFFEKNRNRFKPTSFGYFGKKNRFKPVWLGFFPVWVRFDFFGFRLIKPKPNRTSWFFSKF
jgi:hypothetical protein